MGQGTMEVMSLSKYVEGPWTERPSKGGAKESPGDRTLPTLPPPSPMFPIQSTQQREVHIQSGGESS